ncbi:MAG TPA: hypothetical protein PKI20_15895 [Verrucomicrobiota bacterium]|jgi:hypothetical protein|nr:hypothetical protein [Verrucomicrobiota bacterium]HQL79261.1 hypothetical protein [Verrucomicrobiota bacterium]
MLKNSLPLLLLSLLLAGCATQLTNLTPLQQKRNPNNLYAVEVALNTRQQTLRWQSIQPQIIADRGTYQMRPTPLVSNRWEGLIPVPPGVSSIEYRYKLDYQYNRMGTPGNGSLLSPKYVLQIVE